MTHTTAMPCPTNRAASGGQTLNRMCLKLLILLCLGVLLAPPFIGGADAPLPDDLLHSMSSSGDVSDFGSPVDFLHEHDDDADDRRHDDDLHRAKAANECGGKCSCLGEYMDCANVRMVQFEEHLPDWIKTL